MASLLGGPRRYNELSDDLRIEAGVSIAPNILAARLRHLEQHRLISSTLYQERPRRFQYELTPTGNELVSVLRTLESWAATESDAANSPRHNQCGGAIEWRAWCPTCGTLAGENELDDLTWV